MEDEDPDELELCTPPDLRAIAADSTINILPKISKDKYTKTYTVFNEWKKAKNAPMSENVLIAYFTELALKFKASTLWSTFSMLKSTCRIYDNVDIGTYSKLIAFLKRQNTEYTPKKSQSFTDENIRKFLGEAGDEYLDVKVVLIFGIMGGLRMDEIVKIEVNDIIEYKDILLVKIPTSKTKRAKSFTIDGNYYTIVQKYRKLRPSGVKTNRFFLNYQKNRCTMQPIGKNKLANMPKRIAEYLDLANPHLFTGHSLRRTSTSLLANAGADLMTIKRHGAWRSTNVAESYIDESLHYKRRTANLIATSINLDNSNEKHDETQANEKQLASVTTEACFESTIEISSQLTEKPVIEEPKKTYISGNDGLLGLTLNNCINVTINM